MKKRNQYSNKNLSSFFQSCNFPTSKMLNDLEVFLLLQLTQSLLCSKIVEIPQNLSFQCLSMSILWMSWSASLLTKNKSCFQSFNDQEWNPKTIWFYEKEQLYDSCNRNNWQAKFEMLKSKHNNIWSDLS